MSEAVQGSAPRIVHEGRAEYADPSGLVRAGATMLKHLAFADRSRRLETALDICGNSEKGLVVTGRPTGARGSEFADYLLEGKWERYQPHAKAAAL